MRGMLISPRKMIFKSRKKQLRRNNELCGRQVEFTVFNETIMMLELVRNLFYRLNVFAFISEATLHIHCR